MKSSTKLAKRVIRAPVAQSSTFVLGRPQYNYRNGKLVVQHSEFFSIAQSRPLDTTVLIPQISSDNIQSYDIQPGNSEMFPWLSGIASRYEKYHFTSLAFNYCSRTATSRDGMVVLAVDFDPNDPNIYGPTMDSRVILMSHEGAVSSPVWTDATLRLTPAQLKGIGERWNAAGESSEDIHDMRLSDAGRFFIGLFGYRNTNGATWVGDLVVSYTVEFSLSSLPDVTNSGDTCPTWSVRSVGDHMQQSVGLSADTIPGKKGGPSIVEFSGPANDPYLTVENIGNVPLIKFKKPYYGSLNATVDVAVDPFSLPQTNTILKYRVEESSDDGVSYQMSDSLSGGTAVIVTSGQSTAGAPRGTTMFLQTIGAFLENVAYRFVLNTATQALAAASSYIISLESRSYKNYLHTDLFSRELYNPNYAKMVVNRHLPFHARTTQTCTMSEPKEAFKSTNKKMN